MKQLKQNIVQALITATQSKIDQWSQQIREAIQTTGQSLIDYEEKKRQLLPQLLEAHEKGVSTRELEKITGICHVTIARWIKATKQEKAKENGRSN